MSNSSQHNIYQSVKVLVDSHYRNNPTEFNITDFTYTLDHEISRVSRIYVESAQIPYTYYTTNASNNSITIEYNGLPVTAVVAPGNYENSTILVPIKQALDSMLLPGVTWTVAYDASTFKLTISIAGGLGAFRILVQNDPASVGPSIGFTQDTVLAASLVSDVAMDVFGTRYLVIKSRLIGENRAYTTAVAASYASSVAASAIIHTIPVNADPGGVILDVSREPRYNILGFKTSFQNNIDFRLEDDRGNVVDLNGKDWSVQFIFELR